MSNRANKYPLIAVGRRISGDTEHLFLLIETCISSANDPLIKEKLPVPIYLLENFTIDVAFVVINDHSENQPA